MKEKLLKIIVWVIVVVIATAITILSYFMIVDIETKKPNKTDYTCDIREERYMKRKVFIISPKNVNKTNKTILYFHGGAYMAEATDGHWKFIEKIVNDTGYTVIFPDYPLTPKYNYRDVFEMVKPLYKEIINSVDSENLIIMGDSAGGGLSLALVESLVEENLKMPSKTILISPWLDVRLTNPKIDEVQKHDKNLNKDTLKIAGIAYASEDGINNYLVNPIDGDISKINNLTIFTGTYDILNPDVHILEENAKAKQVNIEIKEYEGASHIWLINEDEVEAYNDFIEVLER